MTTDTTPIDRLRPLVRWLVVRRWYYIVLGVVLALGCYLGLRHRQPMPLREYFTTFRVKYSDPTITDAQIRLEDRPRLYWAMTNPFDRDVALKYFESTRLVIEAGERVNYSVTYRAQGQDVYATRPVDIRFVGQRDVFDHWCATIVPTAEGVWIEGLRGQYLGAPIEQGERTLVPYGDTIQTAVGAVLALRTEHAPTRYPQLELHKMSDVDTQERFDKHLQRHMEGNLIELFLTANCTPAFAEVFFAEIAHEYERFAREQYVAALRDYTDRLAHAIEQVRSGHYLVDSLGLSSMPTSASARATMLADLEARAEYARVNALVLDEGHMLEQLDPVLIRSARQSYGGPLMLYILVVAVALGVPLLLLALELSLTGRILALGHLLRLLPEARLLGCTPSGHALCLALEAECRHRSLEHVFVVSASSDQRAEEVYRLLAESQALCAARGMELRLASSLAEALEACVQPHTALVLVARSGRVRTSEAAAIGARCAQLGITPLVVWYDQV